MYYLKSCITVFLFLGLLTGCGDDVIALDIQKSDQNSSVVLGFVKSTKSTLPNALSFVKIVSGQNFNLGIRADGTLWSWGKNSNGQLGINSTIDQTQAIQVGTKNNWIDIAAGQTHALGIQKDGTLWGWGSNTYGELGNNTTTASLKPLQIGTQTHWYKVVAGAWSSAALKKDMTLWTWGYNAYGQLGTGDTVNALVPTAIMPTQTWNMISQKGYHLLAIDSSSRLWAWGYNGYGQVGDGTKVNKKVPTLIDGNSVWKDVSAGFYHSLARKKEGTLWGWGNSFYGQVGLGNASASVVTPTQIGIKNDWNSISAGKYYSVALDKNGTLWAFGRNNYNQLGDNNSSDHLSAVNTVSSIHFKDIVAAEESTLAISSDDKNWGWGRNYYGELGLGHKEFVTIPSMQTKDTQWKRVRCGENHSVAIKKDGTLWSWGLNFNGQLGTGSTQDSHVPVQIGALSDWSEVSAGSDHSIAILSRVYGTENTLWTWGNNGDSQLGDSTTVTRFEPVQIGTATNWSKVYAGNKFTFALNTSGTLYGWGKNNYYQLGLGDTTTRTTPAALSGTWKDMSIGSDFVLAIDTNDQLYGWGKNSSGQVGTGNLTSPITSKTLISSSTWKRVSAGSSHALAIKSDGTLWAWGSNNNYQLGLGDTTQRTAPTQVGTDSDWEFVSCNWDYSIATKTDGTVWVWGTNEYGAIGSTSMTFTVPTKLDINKKLYQVQAGGHFSAFLSSSDELYMQGRNNYGQLGLGDSQDHDTLMFIGLRPKQSVATALEQSFYFGLNAFDYLYAKGYNQYGQLGLGDNTFRDSFEKVFPEYTWEQVALGSEHAAGIQKNGTLWTWGNNAYHQLGYSGFLSYETFAKQVGSDRDWKKVVCGDRFTAALKNDGTLWVWGDNGKGQLGLNTLKLDPIIKVPTQVGTENDYSDVYAYKDALYVEKNDGSIWETGNLVYFDMMK